MRFGVRCDHHLLRCRLYDRSTGPPAALAALRIISAIVAFVCVFLYELYDDAAAFDAHRGMPHYRRFDAGTAAMIASKDVATWALVQG